MTNTRSWLSRGLLSAAVATALVCTAALPATSQSKEPNLVRSPLADESSGIFAEAESASTGDLVILDETSGYTWLTSVATGGATTVGSTTSWPMSRLRVLGGDLHGDAIGDAVLVRQISSGFQIYGVPWNSSELNYDTAAKSVWGSATSGGFNFDRSRQLMGDVTGDGLDDIVTIHAQSAGGIKVWLHRNTGNSFAPAELWQTLTTGGWSYKNSRQELADLDGDGLLDLVTSHRQATGGLRLWAHLSTGSSFASPVLWQDLKTGGWSYDGSRQAIGDVDGDGLDDIVSSHRQSTGGMRIWAHLSTGASLTAPALWQDLKTGGWSFDNSKQVLVDTDGSNSDDVISMHRAGNGQYRIWIHTSTGASFAQPLLFWNTSPFYLYDGAQFTVSRD